MRWIARNNLIFGVISLVFVLAGWAGVARGGDLPAAGDGQHAWFVQDAPPSADGSETGPRLAVYHLPSTPSGNLMSQLDPIKGTLMPGGIAAGNGRLLLIRQDRQVLVVRPVWSDLLHKWVYQKRSLPALPTGCTLVSLAMGNDGPWALVQVQSRELLDRWDAPPTGQDGLTEEQMFNQALGLPEDFEWDAREKPAASSEQEQEEGQDVSPGALPDADVGDDQGGGATAEADADVDAQASDAVELPAYRLIHVERGKWLVSLLPKDFSPPRAVRLVVRSGDDRPTLLLDQDTEQGSRLVRCNPVKLAEQGDVADEAGASKASQAPLWAWQTTDLALPPGQRWSAGLIREQLVVGIERPRARDRVVVDVSRLRGRKAYAIGEGTLPAGEGAQWTMFPKQDDLALMTAPAVLAPEAKAASAHLPALALLDGQAFFESGVGKAELVPLTEREPSALEGHADLFVQVLAFITAMCMMMVFYRRVPQHGQLNLPDDLVLASLGRRTMAGLIDLAPGFFVASLVYEVSAGQILLEAWPGNGVEKAFVAMRPGLVVIGVTLLHAAVCELVFARSLGKMMMGLSVVDMNGKRASPTRCLFRALSRAFELFAPLMILVAVISPARQRLGDILAKTTVVMPKPEPSPFDLDDDE